MLKSLCFFFPYYEDSGVPVLFYRMANVIAQSRPDIEVYVIDYENGAMARNLLQLSNIHLITFVDGVVVSPPEDSVLVIQSILPYAMRPELVIKPKTKLFFWTLHPYNFVPILFPFPVLRNLQFKHFQYYQFFVNFFSKKWIARISHFIDSGITKNAICFMDQTNFEVTRKYLLAGFKEVSFIPVPVVDANKQIDINKDRSTGLHFCWVGRLCDFKSHILIYTIRKISELASELKINIHYSVIGDGPFKAQIELLKVNHEYFELEIMGALSSVELDDFLFSKVDVLTAMGTSALEGAKFGIPTILLDMSLFPIKEGYCFRWLFDTKNFDLAHEIIQDDLIIGNESLKLMILDITRNFKFLSVKTFNYFKEKHELGLVVGKFLLHVGNTELIFEDIDPKILKKSIIRKVYDKSKSIGYKFTTR